MRKLAIIYDTVSGSTAEMAQIASEVLQGGFETTTLPIAARPSLIGYDAVIIGSPMRFGGFTLPMRRYLRSHSSELRRTTVACFISMLYVIRLVGEPATEDQLFLDPALAMPTLPSKQTNRWDRTHSLGYLERRRAKAIPHLHPVSVGYFKGRLDPARLPLPQRLLMRALAASTSKIPVGDFLNPAAVQDWAASLATTLPATPRSAR